MMALLCFNWSVGTKTSDAMMCMFSLFRDGVVVC